MPSSSHCGTAPYDERTARWKSSCRSVPTPVLSSTASTLASFWKA